MFNRLISLAVLVTIPVGVIAHPGLKPPDDPPDPWDGFTCELPAEGEAIDISYHIWYVGQEQTPELSLNFCATVMDAQQLLLENTLHLRLHPEVATDICEILPATNVTDTDLVDTINDFAEDLHDGDMTWSRVNDFVSEGKDQYFNDREINVYVIHPDLLYEFKGMHLRDIKADEEAKGNLIFVPRNAAPDTLMHEFAHAFSLEHVNFWRLPKRGRREWSDEEKQQKEYCAEYDYWDNECDFRRSNFMWAGGVNRAHLTQGQLARVICNDWSALNTNGDREDDEVFRCPDWALADIHPGAGANMQDKQPCPSLHDGIYKAVTD